MFAPTDRLAFLEVRGTGPDSRESSCYPFEVGLVLTDHEANPLGPESVHQSLVCFDALGKKVSGGAWPKNCADFVEAWEIGATTVYAEGKSARTVARLIEGVAMLGALSVDPEDYPILVCRDAVYSSTLLHKIFAMADMDMPFRPHAIDTWLTERTFGEIVDASPLNCPRASDVATELQQAFSRFLAPLN